MSKEKKQQQPARKLTLHRQTLRNLTHTELGQVHGGIGKISEPHCGSEKGGGGERSPQCTIPVELQN